MKYTTKIYTATLSALMLCAGTTSCSLLDEEIDEVAAHDENVNVNFAFSLNNTSTPSTRLTADMVQSTDGAFRGLSEIYAYPFSVRNRKIQSGDLPKLSEVNTLGALVDASANNSRYYFYENQWFMTGVSSFLVYARGSRNTSLGSSPTAAQIIADRSTYGYLDHADFVSEMNPDDIWFAPMQIRNVDTAPTEANNLAQYLTNIANAWVTIETAPGVTTAYRWSTETQPHLRAYYLNFISLTNTYSTRLMAGSSVNVERLVSELHKLIRTLKETTTFTPADNWNPTVHTTLCQEILAQIESTAYATVSGDDVTLISAYHNYPGSYGLPDGAAALKWNVSDSKFEPQTITTSIANINTMSRFAYPAELFYYANSLIKTSNIDDRKDYYPNTTSESWETMLTHYENNNASVTGNTKALAIIDPLQYAVAHLEAKLKKTATSLKDANNADVAVEDGKFPLTALIIGGQRKVKFDFTQADPSSDTDVRFVYDHSFNTPAIALSSTTETSASVHSLLLQSADDETVPIVAEFQNNTTTTFCGVDGVVYPGTHFYLVGKIDPSTGAGTDDAAKNRVFTQDYTTSVTITVSSLAKAYNVLPNLLSPRLEIGIELMPWKQSTPGNVPLD
ncbi:MAG: hypothetical protein II750_00085 [Bacteroidaceae bacterium]|nr:hypothetical protein [Bacteroidaceae bacterium]